MEKRDNNFLTYLSWFFSYPLIRPDILQIDLTHRCNLDCRMCQVKKYPVRESEELSEAEIIGLISQAKELGVRKLVLSGGEPFLRKDIFAICDYAGRLGIEAVIVSNGTLMDDDLVSNMLDNFKGTISVSLDGLEEAHDYLRGRGSFRKTLTGIRSILEMQQRRHSRDIHLIIGLVITRHNYRDLVKVVELAGELKVGGLYFLPLVRDNTDFTDSTGGRNLWLSPEETDELKIILKDATALAKEKGVNLEKKIPDDLIIKYYRNKIDHKKWLCYGGVKNIFITLCNPEGGEYYQPYLRICMEFIGNVRKDRLGSLWFSKNAFNARRKIKYCRTPCMQPCFPGAPPGRYQVLLNSIFGQASRDRGVLRK